MSYMTWCDSVTEAVISINVLSYLFPAVSHGSCFVRPLHWSLSSSQLPDWSAAVTNPSHASPPPSRHQVSQSPYCAVVSLQPVTVYLVSLWPMLAFYPLLTMLAAAQLFRQDHSGQLSHAFAFNFFDPGRDRVLLDQHDGLIG